MSIERTTKPSRRKKLVADAASVTVHFVTAGQTLSDRYHLTSEVARGGMGVVFEAEDIELENRRVAIKVLPPELSHSAKAKKRLKKEAIAAMELTHQNILRLHGFEQDEDTAYLVMEFLAGDTLDEVLAEHEALSLERVLAIASDVCPALDYAHSKGVIHRDIKPANLMYESENEDSTVKLTDFGIAYVVKDSMTRLTGLESAGTLLYVSPEQLRNDPPSPQSDQYSLASTLYELLEGDPPFCGAGLAHKILEAKVRPIEDMPEHVNGALIKALSKNPDERFSSCGEFLQALKEGPEAIAAPASAPKPEPKPVAVPKPAPKPTAVHKPVPKPTAVLEPETVPEPAPEPTAEHALEPTAEPASESSTDGPMLNEAASSKWDWVFRFYAMVYGMGAYGLYVVAYRYLDSNFYSDDMVVLALLISAMILLPTIIYLISVGRGAVRFSLKYIGLISYGPVALYLLVAFILAQMNLMLFGTGVENPFWVLVMVPFFSFMYIKSITYVVARLEPPREKPPSYFWLASLTLYCLLQGFFCSYFSWALRQYGRSSIGYDDTMVAIVFATLSMALPFIYHFVQHAKMDRLPSLKTTGALVFMPMFFVMTSAVAAEAFIALDMGKLNDGHLILLTTVLFAYLAALLTTFAFSFEGPKDEVTTQDAILGLIFSVISGGMATMLFYCVHRLLKGRFRSDEQMMALFSVGFLVFIPLVHNLYRTQKAKAKFTLGLFARSVFILPFVIVIVSNILAAINLETFRFDFDTEVILAIWPIMAFLIALLCSSVFKELE